MTQSPLQADSVQPPSTQTGTYCRAGPAMEQDGMLFVLERLLRKKPLPRRFVTIPRIECVGDKR